MKDIKDIKEKLRNFWKEYNVTDCYYDKEIDYHLERNNTWMILYTFTATFSTYTTNEVFNNPELIDKDINFLRNRFNKILLKFMRLFTTYINLVLKEKVNN